MTTRTTILSSGSASSMTKTIIVIAGVAFLYGCKLSGPDDPVSDVRPLEIISFGNRDFVKDPFVIDGAELRRLILNVSISYSGGCRDHEVRAFSYGPVILTNPPGADIFLSHDDRGDPCDAVVRETVSFDVSKAKGDFDGPVLLFIWDYEMTDFIDPAPRLD